MEFTSFTCAGAKWAVINSKICFLKEGTPVSVMFSLLAKHKLQCTEAAFQTLHQAFCTQHVFQKACKDYH